MATEDIDIFDQDHMTIEAYDPEGNLTERKIIFSASKKGDPLVSDARERSDQKMRLMELSEQLAPLKPLDLSGPSGPIIKRGGKGGVYPSARQSQIDLSSLKGLISNKDLDEKYLPDPSALARVKEVVEETQRQLEFLIYQKQSGQISDLEFDMYAQQVTQGTPLEDLYTQKFNKGGSVDSQDIFEEEFADQGMYRADGVKKSARGFLGPVKNLISGGTMTEFSTDMNYGGKSIQIPTMVPTLSREEISYLQNMPPGRGWDMSNPIARSVIDKARAHARQRLDEGKSPFYQDDESYLQNLQKFNIGGDVDIFEPDLLDRGVEAYEATPLAAQILAGFTPAGLAADVASAAKYGRDAVRNLVAGQYGEAATPAILASLAAVGLIPVVGDIAKKVGSKAVRDLDMSSAARMQRAKDMGFDTDNVYYHGSHADIEEFRLPSRETGQTKTAGSGIFTSSDPNVAGTYGKGPGAPSIYPVYVNKSEYITLTPPSGGAQNWARISVDGLTVTMPDGTIKQATELFPSLKGTETLTTDQFARIAKEAGHKGVVVKNIKDYGGKFLAKRPYDFADISEYMRSKGIDLEYPLSPEDMAAVEKIPNYKKLITEAEQYAIDKAHKSSDVVITFDPTTIRSKQAKFDPKDRDSANISKAEGGPVEVQNMRFGGVPVPYRRGYRGPIDPSFYYGQAPQMFGRMFANRVGIGALPFIGRPATNLFSRGFQGLGRVAQFVPGSRRIGNFLNRIARPVNRVTAFQDRMNPQNVMTSGIGRLFGGGNQQGGKGMFGLRGKGGLLGFGLLGGRGTPRQVARQQYGGSPSILGSGAFASSYTPKIGEDVVTGRQDSSTRNVPNYTGTIESGDFDIFDTPSEPEVEYSFVRAPRGSIIGTSGFASNIPYARISSLGGGGGFGGSGASSGGFGGGFTFKKEHAQDAGG